MYVNTVKIKNVVCIYEVHVVDNQALYRISKTAYVPYKRV
jgi:hypothetical protein